MVCESFRGKVLFYIIHLELSPMNIVNSNRRPAWTSVGYN
jgi:hypothetical protein